jgi:signal transduction histidine kinase
MEAAEGPSSQARAGVLVVDDYAPNRTALSALLAPIAEITEVDSGARAIDEIGRRDFAVVVLDIRMPDLDGIEVARRIRAGRFNASVPIIFLTAMDGDAAEIRDGYAAGAVDYLRRPLEPIILQSKVSIFVELHQRREQVKRDAAERVRLQAERMALERANQEKDQFLAVLSHELRTPLASILLWTDMLLNKSLPPEIVRRGHETIDICARHEAHMVENVLEMSRLVTGTLSLDMTRVNVNEVIADAVADIAGLAAERHVRVVCTPSPIARSPIGDPLRLCRVVGNLLENAVKFTPTGGRVDVVLTEGPTALTIAVNDEGVGFSPEVGPTLFSRFTQGNASSTRERGGLGLGLALAQEVMALHGGTVTAHSEGVGRGASFTITLPYAPPV